MLSCLREGFNFALRARRLGVGTGAGTCIVLGLTLLADVLDTNRNC
jgi:hypothetical protein